MTFLVQVQEDAKKQILELDFSIREQILKRIKRMESGPAGRHLKYGLPYCIEEIGQYRIAYTSNEQSKEKIIYFVGNHKDYEKWFKQFI